MAATIENMNEHLGIKSSGLGRKIFDATTCLAAAGTLAAVLYSVTHPDTSTQVISFDDGSRVEVKAADLRAAERRSMGTGGSEVMILGDFISSAKGDVPSCIQIRKDGETKVCLGQNGESVLVFRKP